MRKLISIFLITSLLNSCGKDPISSGCSQEVKLVQVKHYDAIQCPTKEINFIFKSENELNVFIKRDTCNTTSNFFEPADYTRSWIIGSSTKINYYIFKIETELNKDTCNKTVEYKLILKQDTSSNKLPLNASPQVKYCIMSAVDSTWKVVFTKQVINTKF